MGTNEKNLLKTDQAFNFRRILIHSLLRFHISHGKRINDLLGVIELAFLFTSFSSPENIT